MSIQITMIENIASRLETEIKSLPEGFHSTFTYVKTGDNRCHSSTIWILAKIISGLPDIEHVGIDVPLVRKGAKIKPDVVGYGPDWKHAVYVDFESPNSSDSRVWEKDCKPYAAYREAEPTLCAPYIIVTSLPDREAPGWQLRWTSGQQYNHACYGLEAEVRRNPFRFWLERWRKLIDTDRMAGVTILNIDDRSVRRVEL